MMNNIPINKYVLKQWLNSGIIENGKTSITDTGVPQGGPISPTIFNIVLNGIEDLTMKVTGVFPIRYADDIILFANDAKSLEKCKQVVIDFIQPRGLQLNSAKSELRPIERGVDILGYNLREYADATKVGKVGKPTKRGIVLVKPSIQAINNFKRNVKSKLKVLTNAPA